MEHTYYGRQWECPLPPGCATKFNNVLTYKEAHVVVSPLMISMAPKVNRAKIILIYLTLLIYLYSEIYLERIEFPYIKTL